MEDDSFELVDRDYDNCAREEYPRQIKTRKKSNHSISQKYTNYRIKQLKKKLEKMKNEAVEGYYYNGNLEQEIEKKSLAIARLEEKIQVLSKEDVPKNYVQKRAIKIKKKMSENMIRNAHDLYSIKKENKEDIFKNESDTEEKIDVASDDLSRKTIEESINAEFTNLEDKKDSMEIGRDAIEESINEEFSNIDNNEIEEYAIPKEDATSNDDTVSNEEIEGIINKSLEDINPFKMEEPTNKIETSEKIINDDSDKGIDLEEENFKMEDAKVSKNNSGLTHMYRYDREGNDMKEYNYVPMTDSEVREAQIRLGLDENGNFIETPRDRTEKKIGTASIVENKISPIVVPNLKLEDILIPPKKRIDEIPEFSIVEEDDKMDSFDNAKEIEEYSTLKEKILYLKQQQEITKKQKEEAQKAAEETAKRAKEIQDMFEQSQQNYANSIDMLKAYQEELEEDCSRNRKGTEEAEIDTRKNNDFINEHQEKMNTNKKIIDEIGSLIGKDSSNIRKR